MLVVEVVKADENLILQENQVVSLVHETGNI
jgi:hypothetical protein